MSKLKNKDIAQALHLSTAAISMALNNKPGVSDGTRKKVLAYYANHADAPRLPDAPSAQKSILLNIHKTTGDIIIEKPFFSKLMTAIEMEARKDGYALIVTHYDSSMNMDAYISSINKKAPAGVLILATELTDSALAHYQSLQAPYVLIDGYRELNPVDAVTLDNQNAVFRAYQYAHACGHKNIGYLKCSTSIPNFEHRFHGFQLGRLTFEQEAARPPVVFTLPGSMDQAQQAMKRLLEQLPSGFEMPSCFLCDMDFIAIGAMAALRESGYRIPEDVSLIGFDDIDYAKIVCPALTTIHLHETALGRESVRLLLDRIVNPHFCVRNIRLTGELIVRDSVRKESEAEKTAAAPEN